jgi:hypothetical protein
MITAALLALEPALTLTPASGRRRVVPIAGGRVRGLFFVGILVRPPACRSGTRNSLASSRDLGAH